ncbi:MAG: type II secretion system F family protein [Candidatus Diapherotrites archaeon]
MKPIFFAGITEKEKSISLKAGILLSVLFLLVFFLISDNLTEGIAYTIGFFCISFLAMNYFFQRKKTNRIKLIEAMLPFMLLPMGSELNHGTPFHTALENAQNNSKKELKKEIEKILTEINNGVPVQNALLNFSKRNPSIAIKRACSVMTTIYLQGAKANAFPLKQIAKEMLLKQKTESKEFASKMVVFSLMFIAVSAIVPAFFLAFVSIGSMFMELDFTPIQIIALSAIIFPAIDLGVLVLIKEKTPVFLQR